jgi:hypothetical protein
VLGHQDCAATATVLNQRFNSTVAQAPQLSTICCASIVHAAEQHQRYPWKTD